MMAVVKTVQKQLREVLNTNPEMMVHMKMLKQSRKKQPSKNWKLERLKNIPLPPVGNPNM